MLGKGREKLKFAEGKFYQKYFSGHPADLVVSRLATISSPPCRSLSVCSLPLRCPAGLLACVDVFCRDWSLTRDHFLAQIRDIQRHYKKWLSESGEDEEVSGTPYMGSTADV